ncbi:tumor necrosis factor receptor superfamily member 16-like isoform X2 [Rhineura floridana]|uniref:tumor necrosis factor receptor superfamily member 16-like isoform X2 n=1 Tax=Rhineura floridana TaxID=261503 RepID=UPI002AC81DA8|nr:tumor necrosis factor receptor superfamily member 16-like isoform X2 [Rhineura floridana]
MPFQRGAWGETDAKLTKAALTCLLLLLQSVSAKVWARQHCENGHFTSAGDCCDLCFPGFGATVPCGSTNTKCEPCQENVMFSSVTSATEPCQPCSVCPGHALMLVACTSAHDTVCATSCPRGHYLPAGNGSHGNGQCLLCQVCPEGYGAVKPCGPSTDTLCQKCPDGFYSEAKSSLEACLPCRQECGKNEVMIQACTPLSDTLCMDKELQILKRSEPDARKDFPKRTPLLDSEGSVPPNSSSSEFVPPLAEDHSKNIIPVYCSILAAVVVGLLAYVAFKCWSTCKQKQQLAKARAGELVSSPEGEKLHSDSGVFLDTHSLQDHHPLNKVHKIEPQLYVNLPPHKQEEVEQLLESPAHGKDWRCLANHLGYEEETIDTFGRGEAPAHTLLSDWSAKEGATLESLCTALAAIERADVVENLNAPAEVSSVV